MRRHSMPDRHWDLPIDRPFRQGLRSGPMIFVGGQVDLDGAGAVRHPGDLHAQLDAVVDYAGVVLEELGADLADTVKIVLFYVNRGDVDETALAERLRRRFPGDVPPALMTVPVPWLAIPGMLCELELIAMRGEDGARLPRKASNPADHWAWPFSHGIRCGEMIYTGVQMPIDRHGKSIAPGDSVTQAKANIENVTRVLAGFGAPPETVCKINTFYRGGGSREDWVGAARVRGNAFPNPGPVGTGIPLPDHFRDGVMLRQEVTAMLGTDGRVLQKRAVRPPEIWDWPIPMTTQQGVRIGRTVFVGGQVPSDHQHRPIHPGDVPAQAGVVLGFIKLILERLDATLDDVVKVNCFYKGESGLDTLLANARVRASHFRSPGPTTTGIPVPSVGRDNLDIEIEALAIVDR